MTNKDGALIQQITCDKSWPYCIYDFTAMQTVNDNFVFKVSSRNHKKKNLNNEDEQDDLNDFILDCDYVTYQSKRQKSQGLIDYESDNQ